jgi:hypothetical protein
MAKEEAKAKDETKLPEMPEAGASQNVNVQLVPSGQSDQPILANFTVLHPASGVALIDFGFLDPGALNALSQMARSGKKMPERMNGRLSARVAVPYDSLVNLHQQIGRVLQAVAKQRKAAQ